MPWWRLPAAVLACGWLAASASAQTPVQAIARVKPAVVAVGTLQKTRTPQFKFMGTGFAVGDGSLVATNAHVLPAALAVGAEPETLVVVAAGAGGGSHAQAQVRAAQRVAVDEEHDLALLKVAGPPLPALRLREADRVEEGEQLMFTGFPIGNALGPYPATHRAMVSAITPIAIPPANSAQLDPKVIRRLQAGSFPVIQLDATAYPGNSGSPLYDTNGDVVGVVNMVFVKGTKESALSRPSGITYAIPSTHLKILLGTLR